MDRTRRLRQTAVMRSMVRENHVRTEELIYPLFVMEGENIVSRWNPCRASASIPLTA